MVAWELLYQHLGEWDIGHLPIGNNSSRNVQKGVILYIQKVLDYMPDEWIIQSFESSESYIMVTEMYTIEMELYNNEFSLFMDFGSLDLSFLLTHGRKGRGWDISLDEFDIKFPIVLDYFHAYVCGIFD